MAIPQTATILHHLRQTVLRRDGAGLSDGHLLRAFLYRGDEAAFEALVRRHGPMVRGVCRRVLRNLDDADDAFQTAFLVLLRKASTLAMRQVIGDWLHGVAYRTALKARTAAARRRLKEMQALRQEAIFDNEDRSEWLPLLDEEVGRLPQKYRLPVVLCDLEGRTRKEAALQLGWPEGTLSGRLSRARVMLARRLTRRGVTLSSAALAAGMAGEACARLPLSLVGSTCKAAMEFAAGSAAASVPAHVAALTEGVVKAMFVTKLKNAVALAAVAIVLTAGAGAWRYVAVAEQSEERPEKTPARTASKAGAVHAPKILPNPIASAAQQGAASQTSEDNPPQPVPPAAIPPADREFMLDVQLFELKEGERKLLAHPRIKTLGGVPAGFAFGDTRTIQLGGGKTEEVAMGPGINVVIRPGKGDKITLDATVRRPTRATFSDAVFLDTRVARRIVETTLGSRCQFAVGDKDQTPWIVTIGVLEVKYETGEKSITKAEKLLKMAEYWRRTGHPGSAVFYYEQLSQDYPDTIYAERAKERMREMEDQLLKRTDLSEADRFVKDRLIESKRQGEQPKKKPAARGEKPPTRVGQIFIIGNEKTSDTVILEQVPLFPGQPLNDSDVREAERNLSRLKGFKRNPKVEVLDRDSDTEFKDIQITVEEK
jgi:RNA polymerase sigma factor (sigma-70 family)